MGAMILVGECAIVQTCPPDDSKAPHSKSKATCELRCSGSKIEVGMAGPINNIVVHVEVKDGLEESGHARTVPKASRWTYVRQIHKRAM